MFLMVLNSLLKLDKLLAHRAPALCTTLCSNQSIFQVKTLLKKKGFVKLGRAHCMQFKNCDMNVKLSMSIPRCRSMANVQ